MGKEPHLFGISSSLVDDDALSFITEVASKSAENQLGSSKLACVISTREYGDNPQTDKRLAQLRATLRDLRSANTLSTPLIEISARRAGRLQDKSSASMASYDEAVISTVQQRCGSLPSEVILFGDMILHGENWCKILPSWNIHPDLPPNLGGTTGIYWDVIGEWVRTGRKEGGGMIHLATPVLDKGPVLSYFRISLQGVVNGVDLAPLWKSLPDDKQQLEQLVADQVKLKDQPTHPLFRELRRAEASFELPLVFKTLELSASNPGILNNFDATKMVVGN